MPQFTLDDVKLFMRAAVEFDRHGTLAADTLMELQGFGFCCDDCLMDAIEEAAQAAL